MPDGECGETGGRPHDGAGREEGEQMVGAGAHGTEVGCSRYAPAFFMSWVVETPGVRGR